MKMIARAIIHASVAIGVVSAIGVPRQFGFVLLFIALVIAGWCVDVVLDRMKSLK
jgi:hypothetical protein